MIFVSVYINQPTHSETPGTQNRDITKQMQIKSEVVSIVPELKYIIYKYFYHFLITILFNYICKRFNNSCKAYCFKRYVVITKIKNLSVPTVFCSIKQISIIKIKI